jgi:hypothetical protein
MGHYGGDGIRVVDCDGSSSFDVDQMLSHAQLTVDIFFCVQL